MEWHHVPLEFEAGHKAHHRDQKGASIIRILLLATALNSLTQRVYVELTDIGHDLAVSLVRDGDGVAAAVEDFLRRSARQAPRQTSSAWTILLLT